MKKLLQWWIQRFILCTLSVIAAFVLLVYAGPRVGMQELLTLEIVEQAAEIKEIVEERRIVADDTEKYEYELMLAYYTADTGYFRTFNIVTTYAVSPDDIILVKYYKKFPNVVYAIVEDVEYQPYDMKLLSIAFNVALFVGIPVGIYTIYFLKKKKKPRLPKKSKE